MILVLAIWYLRPWRDAERHSRIRSTCNNAIVRTAGNNWTIYEPCGLALRMYDYRGKRCVARTPRAGLWRASWLPRPPVITHTATVFPTLGRLWKSRWEFSRRTILVRNSSGGTRDPFCACSRFYKLIVAIIYEYICRVRRERFIYRIIIFTLMNTHLLVDAQFQISRRRPCLFIMKSFPPQRYFFASRKLSAKELIELFNSVCCLDSIDVRSDELNYQFH